MSTAEIIAELPNLSPQERREILDHLIALDDDTKDSEEQVLEFHRQRADEAFQILDLMEAEDVENSAR